MAESKNDRVGQKISNYLLVRLIGHGGFADVYLGEHIYLKTQAAVKILHTRADEAGQSDILNEARAIAQLEHPNIIRLLEYGVEGGYPFLIMSYAARGSLRNYYPRGMRLPAELVVAYVQQMASALDYAHSHKLIHRDVKPENMLIGRNDQLLLTDFGLVMMAQTSRSQASEDLAGTVAYMAPEQLRGRPRFASDQYALGVVVYEWLCGQRPFSGSFAEIASQQVLESPPPLCARQADLPPEVELAVLKALAKDPADRFESVGEFANALAEAYGGAGQLTRRSDPLPMLPVNKHVSQSQPINAGSGASGSVAMLPSSRSDPAATIEIPVDEALTSINDSLAVDTPDVALAATLRQPGESTVLRAHSASLETMLPDVPLQSFSPAPGQTPDGIMAVAPRLSKRRGLKSIFALLALILVVATSLMLGFGQILDLSGTRGGDESGTSLSPTATADGVGGVQGTDPAASPTGKSNTTPGALIQASASVATKPAAMQQVAPGGLIPTNAAATRVGQPTPTSPASVPTPTPVPQETPTPLPTAAPTPNSTIDPYATPTPDSSMSTPTPDPNMIPGLMP